jgi:hypothetical protein
MEVAPLLLQIALVVMAVLLMILVRTINREAQVLFYGQTQSRAQEAVVVELGILVQRRDLLEVQAEAVLVVDLSQQAQGILALLALLILEQAAEVKAQVIMTEAQVVVMEARVLLFLNTQIRSQR